MGLSADELAGPIATLREQHMRLSALKGPLLLLAVIAAMAAGPRLALGNDGVIVGATSDTTRTVTTAEEMRSSTSPAIPRPLVSLTSPSRA